MIEVGRSSWRSSGPTPQPKEGQIDSVAQEDIEYIQGWRFHSQSGWPIASAQSLSQRKGCFLVIQDVCVSLQDVCPLLLVLSWGTTEKNLIPSFPFPHFTYSPEPSLLQAKQCEPFQPFLAGEIPSPIIIPVALHCRLTSSSTSLLF